MLGRIMAGLLVLSGPALAEAPIPRERPSQPRVLPRCAKLSLYNEILSKDYDEAPKAVALVHGGGLLSIYTSREGTFTVLIVSPQKTACLVSAGQDWEDVPESERSRWLDPEM